MSEAIYLDNVTRELADRRAQFMTTCNPGRLKEAYIREKKCLDNPVKKRKRYHRQNSHIRNKLKRRKIDMELANRKMNLFEDLSDQVKRAARTVDSRDYYVNCSKKKQAAPLAAGVQAVRTVLEDVMLCDAGDMIIDTTIQVDDICDCGMLMRRIQTMSCLVCPNPSCHQMRTYIDTSNGSAPFSKNDSQSSSPRRKCLTHYMTFLKAVQCKTNREFSRKYLLDLCRYCYIEGARKPSDICKKIVNAAQTYVSKSGKSEYTQTPLLICLLSGGLRKMPPEVENKLMLMLDCLIPVFEKHKHLLDTQTKAKKEREKLRKTKNKVTPRNNMINFDYTTLINLRMLGYNVYEHLVETFDLTDNQIRHGWFMRLLYKELGWEWVDGALADFPDEVLDKAYFCAMMHRKERLKGEITQTTALVRDCYDLKCQPGECNCFLHNCKTKNGTPVADKFECLEPFVQHVAEQDGGRPITIATLRELAAEFKGDLVFSPSKCTLSASD